MSESNPRKAVILVSGGMDSAVTLAMARQQGYQIHALSVAYGQRHSSELEAAAHVAHMLGAVEHKTVHVDLRSIGGSALTADIDVPEEGGEGIPVTYVPARNTIMLSIALGLGRGTRLHRNLVRRERRGLLRLSGLPPRLYRGVRAPRERGHQGWRRRRRHPHPCAADVHEQGRHRSRGSAPGRRFHGHRELLSGRCPRARLRALRCLPAARTGISRGRITRFDPIRLISLCVGR